MKIAFVIFSCLLFAACGRGSQPSRQAADARLNSEIAAMQEAVEEALVWRAKTARLFQELDKKSEQTNITPADLERVYASAEAAFPIADRLYAYATRYEELAASEDEPGTDTPEGSLLLKKIKLSLGAALVLYDNFVLGAYPFYTNSTLRRMIGEERPDLDAAMQEATDRYLDPGRRERVGYGIALLLKSGDVKSADTETAYLDILIEQSPSYVFMRDHMPDPAASPLERLWRKISDALSDLGNIFTFAFSKIFGNVAGVIEVRSGLLLSLPDEEKAAIAAGLRPLDLLLEKTPFRLTDKFIPGHFGHVAIWVGSEAELRAFGIWDDPVVVPYQERISAGHSIVEALRPGVEINTFQHFLNIDDLVVLRHTNLSDADRRKYLLRVFRQIGKEYDFNFDVETSTRLICSELVYQVFTGEEWPTSKALGRYTISPDNVAVKALARNPFTPILMYHNGRRVERLLAESLKMLLDEDYERFKEVHGFEMRPEL